MTVDPSFDLRTLLALTKPGGSMRNMCYINCWTGWEWRQMAHAAETLADPYVLNLANLGRPGSAGVVVPPGAAAVGFNQKTFDSVNIGTSWKVVDGTNVQNSDGSLTTFGTSGFNWQLATVAITGGGNWNGIAFGGGAYFEADMKWSGTTTQAGGGWPAFWANDIEDKANPFGAADQWPGQPGGTLIWFEPDFIEAFTEGGYGTAFHNWYSTDGGSTRPDVQAMPPAYTFPSGFNHNAYHKYGWLWLPATATTQGRAAAFIDDVEWQRVSWNRITGTVAVPPVLSGGLISTGGLMDTRHLFMILGSGPNNPLTVRSVKVFQASTVNNLIR